MKYTSELIEEVNQPDPAVLPPVNYKTNWVHKWGLRLRIVFVLVTLALLFGKSNWAWLSAAICSIGYGVLWLGARLRPKQASFENIHTVADLIRGIDRQRKSLEVSLCASGNCR